MIAFFSTTNFSSLLHFQLCLLIHLPSKLCFGCLHFGIGDTGVYYFGQLNQQTSSAFANANATSESVSETLKNGLIVNLMTRRLLI